ncbi:hypothetical protein [Haloferula sp.]|uniref:hypothetical protein n=1 Tax=Haloferula sp. TaxID=2497595 RepID=UPI00329AB000
MQSTTDTTQTYEYGSDLTDWSLNIAVNTDGATKVEITPVDDDVETVTVTVLK